MKSKWVLIAIGVLGGWLFATGKFKTIIASLTSILKPQSTGTGAEND